MEIEIQDGSENTVPDDSIHPPKRGRGRPRGSLNKKFTTEKAPTDNARTSKKVDFFAPEMIIKSKVKKRGRPKKTKIRGRPRKIPLTPEEESEKLHRQSIKRKRKLWKPLGRPRIHPIVGSDARKTKRGRGRPRKYEATAESPMRTDTDSGENEASSSVEVSLDEANGIPRKRGRPSGTFKKKRGRPSGSAKVTNDGTPRKRGRPPGSGSKVKKVKAVDGSPRKRGRPPGSSNKVKIIRRAADGSPRKRGRPRGSGKKVIVTKKNKGDAPRKRGRPRGSGKIKLCVPDDVDLDLSYAGTSTQHRKRGRPRLTVMLEKLPSTFEDEDKTEADDPSPKRFRNSDSPVQVQNETTEEVPTTDEKNAEVTDEADNSIDCQKVNNVCDKEVGEGVGSGKFKKKK